MSRADKNSQAALDWARKKKEQMERAKRLREERKSKVSQPAQSNYSAGGSTGFSDVNADRGYQPNMGGGMDSGPPDMYGGGRNEYNNDYNEPNMGGYSQPQSQPQAQRFSNGHRGGYGSSNYRPSSNEEIAEARQSLLLLKNKMKSKQPMR